MIIFIYATRGRYYEKYDIIFVYRFVFFFTPVNLTEKILYYLSLFDALINTGIWITFLE